METNLSVKPWVIPVDAVLRRSAPCAKSLARGAAPAPCFDLGAAHMCWSSGFSEPTHKAGSPYISYFVTGRKEAAVACLACRAFHPFSWECRTHFTCSRCSAMGSDMPYAPRGGLCPPCWVRSMPLPQAAVVAADELAEGIDGDSDGNVAPPGAALIARARAFAFEAHRGQLYGFESYDKHLRAVVHVARRHAGVFATGGTTVDAATLAALLATVFAALYLHDTLEDVPAVTESLLATTFSPEVARIVAAVTDRAGDTWEARKKATYPATAKEPLAIFVKLCDRIANMREGLVNWRWSSFADDNGDVPRKLLRYALDTPRLRAALHAAGAAYTSLWAELDAMTAVVHQRMAMTDVGTKAKSLATVPLAVLQALGERAASHEDARDD